MPRIMDVLEAVAKIHPIIKSNFVVVNKPVAYSLTLESLWLPSALHTS